MVDETSNPKRSSTLIAAIWMIGAILSFSAIAVTGRTLQSEMTTFEIMLFRAIFGTAVVTVYCLALGRMYAFRPTRLGLHVVRNLCHFVGQNFWLYALTLIPLAHVFALEFTSPLWVALLAPFFLAERLTRLRTLAAGLGFLGVLTITQPDPQNINMGHIAAVLAALGFAGTAISTKLLTRSVPTSGIMFWMSVTQIVIAVTACLFDGRLQLPSATMWPELMILSASALCAHVCLTQALALAPATTVFPFDFMRLPLITVVGAIFYDEPVNLALFLGAALIFGANWVNLRSRD